MLKLSNILLYLTASLGFSSCASHYYMNKVECDEAFGGTVWFMRKDKTDKGIIFSEDRLTFPEPYKFSKRFTPTPEEVEVADKILKENIGTIISYAKRTGAYYNLKNKNSLKNYFCQYFGGINELGERQIFINMFPKSDMTPRMDYTNIIVYLDGGDSYITVLVNLDTVKLDEFTVGGLG